MTSPGRLDVQGVRAVPVWGAEPLPGGEQAGARQVLAEVGGDELRCLVPAGSGLNCAAYGGDESGKPSLHMGGGEGHCLLLRLPGGSERAGAAGATTVRTARLACTA